MNENVPDARSIDDNMVGLEGLNEDCNGNIKVHDLRSGLGDENLEQNTDATSGLHPPGLVGLPENFVQNTRREARFIWPDSGKEPDAVKENDVGLPPFRFPLQAAYWSAILVGVEGGVPLYSIEPGGAFSGWADLRGSVALFGTSLAAELWAREALP